MYKISCIRDGARDPDTIILMLKNYGIKAIYSSEDDELLFPDFNRDDFIEKDYNNYNFQYLQTSTPDFDFDHHDFMEKASCMFLDHREVGGFLEELLKEINMLLNSVNLKLIEVDTQSDYMSAFVTKSSAKTAKQIVNECLILNNNSKFKYKDFITRDIKPDKSKKEYDVRSALSFINGHTRIKDEQVNFELLQEFLEDLAPNYKYGLVERGGKRFIKIEEYKD